MVCVFEIAGIPHASPLINTYINQRHLSRFYKNAQQAVPESTIDVIPIHIPHPKRFDFIIHHKNQLILSFSGSRLV